jgi:hypothetical protein
MPAFMGQGHDITREAPDARRGGAAGAAGPSAPVKAVLAVMERWHIPDAEASAIMGSDDPGFVGRLRSGEAVLGTRDLRDRARLLLDTYEGVYSLLRNPEAERTWINLPRDDFGGQSLLELMAEGSQRNLIRSLGFVDYVNGR